MYNCRFVQYYTTTRVDVPGSSFLCSRCSGCVQEWTGCWLLSVLGLIYATHFRLRRGPKSRAQAPYPHVLCSYVCSTKSSTIVVPSTNHHSPWDTRPTVTIPRLDFVFFFFIPTNTPTNMCAQFFAHTVLINDLRIDFHQHWSWQSRKLRWALLEKSIGTK